ncbi:MAG: hypothetical protein K6F78_03580 [Bacteroidaceae bacterium]|nr:hypothetical protein [Bacteroidaceae bacterium]
MRCFHPNVNQPTEELVQQILEDLTKSPQTNSLIESYRSMKHQMAEFEARQQVEEFVKEVTEQQSYKDWLTPELKKDERRRHKLIPPDDLRRVKLYINEMKRNLPAVIPTATFTESTDRWGRTGRWRVQSNCHLTGLAVLDADHVPNAEAVADSWLKREDFNDLGIVWIFITPSGEGIKVVFKAREDWGNLADNYYTLAEKLGVLEYADGSCKNADRCHYIPRYCDIKFIDWQKLFNYENPAYEQRFGEDYRQGKSEPTQKKWLDFERQRKTGKVDTTTQPAATAVAKNDDDEKHPELPTTYHGVAYQKIADELLKLLGTPMPGDRHATMIKMGHLMAPICDNDARLLTLIISDLPFVKDIIKERAEDVEYHMKSICEKKSHSYKNKLLTQAMQNAGLKKDVEDKDDPMTELPFDEWTERIRGLFDIYPCVREVCEPHPERLWPFLFFASAALLGTDMTLCWYRFYDEPERMRRLNYNVLGIGDPASGKGALVRIAALLTEPLEQGDQLANDAMNNWKEEQRSKGMNKDKAAKPKGIVRLHGPRTSNNVFINDMVNAWSEVDGERMQMHLLTIDTEALNSIKLQKGGSWIDKQVLEIKAWSNEKDSQQYSNLDSVTGFFNVYWNLVRTCTPPALRMLCNENNFGTGYPTRLSAIPVPGTCFKMIELRKQSKKALDANETLRQWAYRMDKRQGELPFWPLVEHCWHWTDDHMQIAAFNDDKADEMLLKRCAANSLAIVAPFVDMRHFEEREKNGTYEVDDTDKELCSLVLEIQYRTQHYYFGELARNYFDEQMKDATRFRRRTTRYEQCYQQLPDTFTTEQFVQVFGYVNAQSANKTLNRLLVDKVIARLKRGEYKKRVQNIK